MRHLLKSKVRFVVPAGVNEYGDPIDSPPYEIPAMIQAETDLITDPDGNEIQSEHKIVTMERVPWDSRIWLDTDDTSKPPIRRPLKTKALQSPTTGVKVFETWL